VWSFVDLSLESTIGKEQLLCSSLAKNRKEKKPDNFYS
jgi:hypothetical protein